MMMAGMIILAVVGVAAQPAHPPPRTSLHLEPAMQKVLEQTMREHLEALQAIVEALGQENYERAAAIAHEELGFPKHHQAMQREQGTTFPKKYQQLAIAHHQAAEDLAKAIPTEEIQPILQKLDQTMKACVDCHQAYKR
jgi:hypothetical protein